MVKNELFRIRFDSSYPSVIEVKMTLTDASALTSYGKARVNLAAKALRFFIME